MNKTFYKKQDLATQFSNFNRLGEAFKKIETDLEGSGQAVCQFIVNGMRLSEGDEEKFSKFSISDVESIEVESEEKNKLLLEVLRNWTEHLPNIIKQNDQLAEKFKQPKTDGLFKEFVELVDSCQFLIDSLISLKIILSEQMSLQTSAWKESQEMTAHAISQALDAFEKKDFVLLADVLEYDLGSSLQNWLEIMRNIKGYVEQKEIGIVVK